MTARSWATRNALELATTFGPGRRLLLARHRSFDPSQLWALCEASAAAVASTGGAVVEVGVAAGARRCTSARHYDSLGLRPRYVCIDTFSGFTAEDIAVERDRGKDDAYAGWFSAQSERLFRRTMEVNGLGDRVEVIRADAGRFAYDQLPDLAFALVDVDLHRPMLAALQGCWDRLLPGGVLVADDCQDEVHAWDGARQAYVEFCESKAIELDVRHGKLGFAQRR